MVHEGLVPSTAFADDTDDATLETRFERGVGVLVFSAFGKAVLGANDTYALFRGHGFENALVGQPRDTPDHEMRIRIFDAAHDCALDAASIKVNCNFLAATLKDALALPHVVVCLLVQVSRALHFV